MASALFRKKSIQGLQAEAEGDHGMKRALSALDLTSIGVGGIVGAGIFVLTGHAAAAYAGPAIIISFAFAAVACAFAGLCYAEFAAMIPIAGSAYTYSYATLGEFFAWFIGWDLVLEYAMGASTVAVGWSGYFVSMLRSFGIHLPPTLLGAPGSDFVLLEADVLAKLHGHALPGWYELKAFAPSLAQAGVDPATLQHATSYFNLPAVLIVALVSAVLIKGIRESAMMNTMIVVLKVSIIITVIAVGFAFIHKANWVPFIPPNTGEYGKFGWSGIARGAGVIFFAYIGFDAVSTAAQEAKRPQRDMPIGILGSLVICTVLYILVSFVLTGVVHYSKLNVADPIAVAIDAMGIHWLAILVKLAALAGLTSVVLVLLLGQSRIFYSMSKDGLLPRVFSAIHPRWRTPARTSVITGTSVALVAAVAPIGLLGELVSIGTLSAFVIVCLGVLVLRYRHPELPRPFRTPGVPYVPILGVLSCLYLMAGLPLDTWIRLVVWLLLGLVIYFRYGIKRSVLAEASGPAVATASTDTTERASRIEGLV